MNFSPTPMLVANLVFTYQVSINANRYSASFGRASLSLVPEKRIVSRIFLTDLYFPDSYTEVKARINATEGCGKTSDFLHSTEFFFALFSLELASFEMISNFITNQKSL